MNNAIINSDMDLNSHIPQKPPNIPNELKRGEQSTQIPSFKEKLLAYESMVDINSMIQDSPISPINSHAQESQSDTTMEAMMLDTPTTSTKGIKKNNINWSPPE